METNWNTVESQEESDFLEHEKTVLHLMFTFDFNLAMEASIVSLENVQEGLSTDVFELWYSSTYTMYIATK